MFRSYTGLSLSLAFLVFFVSSTGFAQSDVNEVVTNINESGQFLPGLVAALIYISGVLMAVSGLVKTVDHVTNPAQTPIRTPVSRFLLGGALFAFPIITEAVVLTINGGNFSAFDPSTEIITLLNGLLGTFSVGLTLGTNFNAILDNIIGSTALIPQLVATTSYLLALVIGASALYKTRDHVEDPTRIPLKDAVIRYLLAGSLLALPTIFEAMFNTIADGGLGIGGTLGSLVGAIGFFFSSDAGAIACDPTGITNIFVSSTVGSVICNSMVNALNIPVFLAYISYLIGLILGVWALFKIRDHVVDPSRTGLHEGVSRLIAGGAFFAFPYLTVILRQTVTPTVLDFGTTFATNTGFNEDLNACAGGGFGLPFPLPIPIPLPGGGGGTGGPSLDQAIGCFMNDILGPSHVVLNFFATVAGMIFIMIGISRLIKSSQEGPRGPGGLGTISTFVTGAILLSATTILRAFSTSLFGSPVSQTRAALTYATGLSPDEQAAVDNVISAVVRFLIIIGLISFVRGIFIMRDVAEGKGQASTMSGLTHIIGGALAVNIGPVINAVQFTLGITEFGINFT